MLSYAADLKQYPKDAQAGLPNPQMVALGLQDEKQASPIKGVKKNTTTDNTKLKDTNKINKMFPEWKSLVWERLKSIESPWIDQTAIAALTGCRPVELERGITVENTGDRIVITIPGAKVRENSGQPWRRFTIKNDGSAEWSHLASRVAAGCSQEFKSHAGEDAFTKALERAGAQVLPKAPSMSAYVYRHSLASDMKADGAGRVEIAMALGHAVTKTQDTYGRAAGGKSGMRSMKLEAAREVKITHDTRYTNPTPTPPHIAPTAPPSAPPASANSFTYSSPSFDL
jgi:integrase